MASALDEVDFQTAANGLSARRDVANPTSMGQTVAQMVVSTKLVGMGILARDVTFFDLFPEVKWIILKLPDRPNADMQEILNAAGTSDISIILWTSDKQSSAIDVGNSVVLPKPALGSIGSLIVASMSAQKQMVMTGVAPEEVHVLVQSLQAEVGPVAYVGVEMLPLACAAVGIADGIMASDVAKCVSSAICFGDSMFFLGTASEIKGVVRQTKYEPMAAVGCFRYFGIITWLTAYGICCGCSWCPLNPENRARDQLEQLAALAGPPDPSFERIKATEPTHVVLNLSIDDGGQAKCMNMAGEVVMELQVDTQESPSQTHMRIAQEVKVAPSRLKLVFPDGSTVA
eukprot:TRINITY_DN41936_c0_g1_i1.p1 TRINITY_DN41936_c0_g1~~TRINITY_DN41936_c0_g1_i1.p1  ORF type:complete len:344 (+),score=67.22 TRINITY_DN41936_c0_g1_i1:90-1121(+)